MLRPHGLGRRLDHLLDTPGSLGWDADSVETVQGVLGQLTDRLYSVLHDRVEVAESARALHPGQATPRCALSYLAVETVLQTVNRLEVRGRDSAGVSIWVRLATTPTAPRCPPRSPAGPIRCCATGRSW